MTGRGVTSRDTYARYVRALGDRPLPAAMVDLDAVDRNIETVLAPVRAAGKHLRIASKSVRCVALLRYITDHSNGCVRGVMAYTAREAEHLVRAGFDDVLIAYPSMHPAEALAVARANAAGATVRPIVDDAAQLAVLATEAKRAGTVVPVTIDVDMSYRLLGGRVHLGVRRSPIHDVGPAVDLARTISTQAGLRFDGVMGYEAQIAGLPDQSRTSAWLDPVRGMIKRASGARVRELRGALFEALRDAGLAPNVFNGGGTGSVHSTSAEPWLTEVTAGSGFLGSHLFDSYDGLSLVPACCFALQVTRIPAPGFATCHAGGYIASGASGADRLPIAYLPEGLELTSLEGAGEVQTPLHLRDGVTLRLGDRVFFRHAKSGEIAEHFNHYALVRGDRVVEEVPTYRGEGCAFG